MKSYLMCAVLAVSLTEAAQAEESYLCISDKSTGFKLKSGTWQRADFHANGKYIISKATKIDIRLHGEHTYSVKQFGEKVPIAYCKNGFNEFGTMTCSYFYEFKMNKNTLRFLLADLVEYWPYSEKTDTDSGTPLIEIGKCSPL